MMAAIDVRGAAADYRYGFASARRLKTPAEFAAVLRAPREQSIRAARQLLSINAAWVAAAMSSPPASSVRFGVTVGKRNARRSVDRALIKRIVREACRHQAAAFEAQADRASARIDVAVRLKAPLVDKDGEVLAMRAWRRQLRAEADDLLHDVLSQMVRRLSAGSSASG
ncbi:MAG: ribonuclease P protein component [Burkholderiaceae bacterium]